MKQFRTLLYFCIGLLLGANITLSHAAFTSYQGSAFRTINGTTYWKGDAGTFAQSQARVIESVNVGGKYVGVAHVGEFGAAAVQLAVNGLKLTPKGIALSLAAGALADWLTSQGYSFGLDSLMREADPVQGLDPRCWVKAYGTGNACGVAAWEANVMEGFAYLAPFTPAVVQADGSIKTCRQSESWFCFQSQLASSNGPTCPAGYTPVGNGMCSSGEPVPMTDADWTALSDKLQTQTNDAVKADLCRQASVFNVGAPGCPVSNPKVTPTVVPLSDWVQNPDTGKWSRTVAKVAGAPTPEDPFRKQIDVEVETQDRPTITNDQGQTVDAETGEVIPPPTKTTEEEKDFCTLHPDALACWEKGEPEDVDLDSLNKTVAITPDTGWGLSNATCPADLIYTTHFMGKTIAMKWKPVCDGALMFRPVVLGMAWLAAIFAFLAMQRKAQS